MCGSYQEYHPSARLTCTGPDLPFVPVFREVLQTDYRRRLWQLHLGARGQLTGALTAQLGPGGAISSAYGIGYMTKAHESGLIA